MNVTKPLRLIIKVRNSVGRVVMVEVKMRTFANFLLLLWEAGSYGTRMSGRLGGG